MITLWGNLIRDNQLLMTAHTNESAEVPTWFSILIAIILLTILIVFGDMFVFILGFLGVAISFAANYIDKDAHH